MMIFLSYASEQRDLAEEIKLALVASGHDAERYLLPIFRGGKGMREAPV